MSSGLAPIKRSRLRWRLYLCVVASLFLVVGVSLRAIASPGLGAEFEAGLIKGTLSAIDHQRVEGLLLGATLGYRSGPFFGGVGIQGRYFEVNFEGEPLHLTNVPIGLVARMQFPEGWRASVSWHWDDVLYSDFRFKWQSGFKIPKDYDLAYEGPGSWNFGISRSVTSKLDLQLSYSRNTYSRFKRRRPEEVIGDVRPAVSMETVSLSLISKH